MARSEKILEVDSIVTRFGELVKERGVGPVLFGLAAGIGCVAVLLAGVLAVRRLGEPRPRGRG